MSTKLEQAWLDRMKLLADANISRIKSEALDKDRYQAPKSGRISAWFGSIEAYYASQFEREKMGKLRYDADKLWHDAVTAEKGNIRVTWDELPNGYKCTLETGEVFEP